MTRIVLYLVHEAARKGFLKQFSLSQSNLIILQKHVYNVLSDEKRPIQNEFFHEKDLSWHPWKKLFWMGHFSL